MTSIHLVRHGQAAGDDGEDPGLSAEGIAQIGALAERLRGTDVGTLLHGPRRRARQSAEILGTELGLEPVATDLLEDRTPHPSATRWEDYPRERWAWLRETPAEERDEDAAELRTAWSRIAEHARSDAGGPPVPVLAVTHAFVVGSFVTEVLGARPDAWMRLVIANASLTELVRRDSGEWAAASVGDVGHLRSGG